MMLHLLTYTGGLHRRRIIFVRLCARRHIATLIWWMQVPRLSLSSSRPYALAVPEVLWTTEQIVGYFIGKTGSQLGSHHKARQMFR